MAQQPVARLAPPGGLSQPPSGLSRAQKAAIIVRFLLNEGADVPINELPDELQRKLTTQMGTMRFVDRTTLGEVVAEFAAEVESMGLTFPRGVAGALTALDGRISQQTAHRLRKEAGVRQFGEPWEQVCAAPKEALLEIIQSESIEVAAVLMSKLDVTRAAELLGQLPGALARRIAYEISQINSVTPDAVDRIGLSLASQLHEVPDVAFSEGPDKRVGEILNCSTAETRDDVLTSLDEKDESFAARVRKAIFTFVNVPDRVSELDLPNIVRDLDRDTMLRAFAHAQQDPQTNNTVEFVLGNISGRMADALREEISDLDKVSKKDGEAAMTEVVNTIRRMEAAGDIVLVVPGEDNEDEDA
ncbi:MAG: FliG C-terminal domain-containing protein [Pseudomonadota bacterium]